MNLDETKKKFMKWFLEEPKTDIWKSLAITMFFIYAIASPSTVVMLTGMQVGLISPESEVDYDGITTEVAESLIEPVERLHQVGVEIHEDNPFAARVVFYALSALIWGIYFGLLILILNLTRYLTSLVYKEVKKRGKKK